MNALMIMFLFWPYPTFVAICLTLNKDFTSYTFSAEPEWTYRRTATDGEEPLGPRYDALRRVCFHNFVVETPIMENRMNILKVIAESWCRGARKGHAELHSAHQHIFCFSSKDVRIFSHSPVKDGGRAMMRVHACVAYEFCLHT